MKRNLKIFTSLLFTLLCGILFIPTSKAWYVENSTLTSAAAYNSSNPYAQSGYWGQCTWYAWGRMYERNGVALPANVGHAGYWYQNMPSQYKSTTLQANSIIVIGTDSAYSSVGHVVYLEEIRDGNGIISEANYDGSGTISGHHEDVIPLSRLCVGCKYYQNGTGTIQGYIVSGTTPPPTCHKPSGTVQNLGDSFKAYINAKSDTTLTVTPSANTNGGVLKLQSKSYGTLIQQWQFTRTSSGAYSIVNVGYSKSMDVYGTGDANNEQVQTWNGSGGNKQTWYIYDYNGGYRLVPVSSNSSCKRALDITNGTVAAGTKMELYEALNDKNNAQTFQIQKVLTNFSLNKTNVTLNVGETFTLSVSSKTPTDVTGYTASYTSTDPSVAAVTTSLLSKKITAKKAGTTTIKVTMGGITRNCTVTVVDPNAKTTGVKYTTHVQNLGWQSYVSNGSLAGTSGKGLRLEGVKIELSDKEYAGDIEYRTHVQNIGWQNYVSSNVMSGTSGKGLRLEAIQIKLTGNVANYYDVYYRVHAQNFGWLGWVKNGESAGTEGFGYRLEGLEVKLVKKGSQAPTSTVNGFYQKSVNYQVHVQNLGWQNRVSNGAMSGTSGKGLRLEGIKLSLGNMLYQGNIEYRTHIENIGWETTWKKNGELSGTNGKGLRLEAIQIKLTGNIANYYDVYYRVHAQNFGWLGWAKNGESSGTSGYSYRLEGIEVKLVEKGASVNSKGKVFYTR